MSGSEEQTVFTHSSEELLLPPGTRLLHIGPFKTGTTALQGAFSRARDALADKGVIYPAPPGVRHWLRPTIALTGAPAARGRPKGKPRHWRQLVAAFERAGDNTVLHSSEYFCECERQHIERAVEELCGSHPTHIAITVRPLRKILPSQWQMHVQSGWVHTPYETWLRQVLDDAPIGPNDPTARFWLRHEHAQLAARWADVVGSSNVTVIVLDPHDRDAILRPFEAMLGLSRGFFEFAPGVGNESLPHSMIELLRRINREFDENNWDDADYWHLIRNGAVVRLHADHKSLPAEPAIRTPSWALERVTEIGERIADELAGLGVRVVGDLDNLRHRPGRAADAASRTEDEPGEHVAGSRMTVDAASRLAIGILEHQQEQASERHESLARARQRGDRTKRRLAETRKAAKRDATPPVRVPRRIEHRRVADVGSLALIRELARRGRHKLTGLLSKAGR